MHALTPEPTSALSYHCDIFSVDHTTAEVTESVLEMPWGEIAGLHELIFGLPWLSRQRLWNCDRCASNSKCLDNMALKSSEEVFLLVYCHVHMVSTCLGHAYAVCALAISGMIAASVTMNQVGMLQGSQVMLVECLKARLCIRKRPPPRGTQAALYRTVVLDKCLGPNSKIPGTVEFLWRRILETYLNGDWARDIVEHFCDDDCCSCEAVTIEALSVVAWALGPSKIPIVPRHRWTGAPETLKPWMLLAACHNLLPAVAPEWTQMTSVKYTPKGNGFSLSRARRTTDIDVRSLAIADPSDGRDLLEDVFLSGDHVHGSGDLDNQWEQFQIEEKPDAPEELTLFFVCSCAFGTNPR